MEDFNVVAEIRHVNIRKEGQEKEVLAIDVKLRAKVSADLIDDLMCAGTNEGDAIRAFWTENEAADPRFIALNDIEFGREFRNVTVSIIEMVLYGCSLNKFKFIPLSGHNAIIEFSVHLKEPPAYGVDRLASMLAVEIPVAFRIPQGDLFEDKQENAQ